MINFDRIKFSNLGSYGDVPFELCFRDARVFTFTGANGSGKSTLLEALAFVLYGKPWRKIPKAKLVNNKNKRGTRVEIWFSDDRDEYYVLRGIKPDLFEIRRNGELLNKDAKSADYQKVLEGILGLSWDAFNQVVIIGKATYVPFMQLDAAKRRSFVESVLNLRVFSDMRDHHRVEIAGVEKSQAAAKGGYDAALPSVDTLKTTLESYSRMRNDAEMLSAADAKAILDGLRNKLGEAARNTRVAEEAEQTVVAAVRGDILAAAKQLEGAVAEASAAHQAAAAKEATCGVDRQAVLDFVTAEERDAARLEKDASRIDTRTTCPTCGGPVDATNAERHANELKAKAAEHRANADAARPDLQAATLALDEAKNAVQAASQAWREADRRHAAAKSVSPDGDPRVVAAREAVRAAKAAWDEVTGDIRHAEAALEQATKRETELDGLIEAAQARLVEAEGRVAALRNDVETAEKTLQVYSVVTNLLKDTGAKATIIRRYVPVINNIVNDLLADMGFFARFELDDEFEDKIMSQGFEEMSYNSYSEGEKLRIDMAVLLAWRELCILTGSSSTNLMIFDEILDGSFDQAGLDAFMTAMNEKDNLHLICITHHPDRIDHFVERHLAFAKVDGYSTYALSTD